MGIRTAIPGASDDERPALEHEECDQGEPGRCYEVDRKYPPIGKSIPPAMVIFTTSTMMLVGSFEAFY